ncbi:hypothetical protein LguiB_025098 [Lonicera macranthoides]
MDVETFYDGIVVSESETASVGALIGLLVETEEKIAQAKAKASSSTSAAEPLVPPPAPSSLLTAVAAPLPLAPVAAPTDEPRRIVSTPYAKKLAKQHKIDINAVVGTRPFRQITAADIEATAGITPVKSAIPNVASVFALAAPPKVASATMSKNMLESLSVPTFRVGYPVTTDALDTFYEKVKPNGATMTALLARAAAMALAQLPVVNSSCKDGKNFTYNSSINCNDPTWLGLDHDKNKIKLYVYFQMVSGTGVTIILVTPVPETLCMFEVDSFDAILPAGQGAIMAVGASKPTVVAGADGFFTI